MTKHQTNYVDVVPLFLLDLTVVMNDDDGDHVGENGREATTDHLK